MALDFLGDFFGGGGMFGLSGIMGLVITIGFGLAVVGSVGGFAWYMLYKRKQYNLLVEIKIPRSDGRLVDAEWGKAAYSVKRGVVHIKRKGKKPIPMKPFDVKKYLQGSKVLTVVQIGAEQYLPVLQESFLEMEDDITGERAALMTTKIDLSESKAWRNSFERESKSAYTIGSLLKQYLPYIGFGIILFMNFVGFAILYTKVT